VACGAWAACIVLAFFGLLLDLPDRVLELSPFEAVPAAPGEPVRALPLVVVSAVAVGAALAGFVRLGRRDLG
jgi:ABC-2 type transport system permease protein